MDIKTVEQHVEAWRAADKFGIYCVYYDDKVHVDKELFEELFQQSNGSYSITNRASEEFPFEVSFKINDITYYSLYSKDGLKNIFGGNDNELVTTN